MLPRSGHSIFRAGTNWGDQWDQRGKAAHIRRYAPLFLVGLAGLSSCARL